MLKHILGASTTKGLSQGAHILAPPGAIAARSRNRALAQVYSIMYWLQLQRTSLSSLNSHTIPHIVWGICEEILEQNALSPGARMQFGARVRGQSMNINT